MINYSDSVGYQRKCGCDYVMDGGNSRGQDPTFDYRPDFTVFVPLLRLPIDIVPLNHMIYYGFVKV